MIDKRLITPVRQACVDLCKAIKDHRCEKPKAWAAFANNDDARLLAWRLVKTAHLIISEMPERNDLNAYLTAKLGELRNDILRSGGVPDISKGDPRDD